ncbi:conserved hypothetical protein [Theileria equi strain WA]|uniref:Uncharacterized protein n=1 Tax=Theileria equi strain WA TaxID=1537102 RepID=L1LB41_THEEQ|nr:conserved hypothetical protein [Theileria equi strain WA]EKX72662.1 conserved hypothetical protein [Theileria equi strain WA]|eukprot:XP_004832114.1 conserved hypothetical protein [Theileria equi strain WA]
MKLLRCHALRSPTFAARFCQTTPFNTINRRCYSSSSELEERKDLLLWQIRLLSVISMIAGSTYLSYVFISNDFDLKRTRRRVLINWNGLFYGHSLPKRHQAIANSRFNVALCDELKTELCRYFVNLDIKKDNGVRRADALCFLEEVGIIKNEPVETKEKPKTSEDKIIEKFISLGHGQTKTLRTLSGCTLQEFCELIEALVMEERLKSNAAFEEELIDKVKILNSKLKDENYLFNTSQMPSNPLVTKPAREMASELRKYIQKESEENVAYEIQDEIKRNVQLKKKLEDLSKVRKLTDTERKRLNGICDELESLKKELSKHKHAERILLF